MTASAPIAASNEASSGRALVYLLFGLVYGLAADSQIARRLDELIRHDMEDKGLQTLSIMDHDRVTCLAARRSSAGIGTCFAA